MSKIERSHAGVYEKTRRYEVPAGTKCASVVVDFDPRLEPRFIAEAHAIHEAKHAFREMHGQIDQESMELSVTHCTFQIVVEIREILP
jgi:hypothetical protein